MRLFHTLYGRLALALTLLLTVVGAGFVMLSLWVARDSLEALNQDLHRSLAANLVQEKLIYVDGEINEQGLEGIFHDLMVVNPAIECYLLDLDGRVVRYSGSAGAVALDAVDPAPIKDFLAAPPGVPIRGDDPRDPGRRKVFSAAPVMVGDAYQGYLYVVLGGQRYESVFDLVAGNYVIAVGLIAGVGLILFALISGLILFYALTSRIRALSRGLEEFEANGFEGPRPVVPDAGDAARDEIGRLSRRFRGMATRIIEQVEQLRETDALRRELVANVSHDLRTPLASLKGYLETLLIKEGELEAREQRHYLEIAIRHANRLARLVEDLFELAKLDARREAPRPEPFALDELVMDILQKFELEADRREIQLESTLSGPLPHALAEIGLIERALENLIDNALRHTPPGGSVTVRIEPRSADLVVRVEDTGRGIPGEELDRLFEPFVRLEDPEAETEGRGAGLGLAIVKRILELHQRAIEVESREGQGTVFRFSLASTA